MLQDSLSVWQWKWKHQELFLIAKKNYSTINPKGNSTSILKLVSASNSDQFWNWFLPAILTSILKLVCQQFISILKLVSEYLNIFHFLKAYFLWKFKLISRDIYFGRDWDRIVDKYFICHIWNGNSDSSYENQNFFCNIGMNLFYEIFSLINWSEIFLWN